MDSLNENAIQENISRLVNPLITIIRYYPNRRFERRILFFTWAANLFKPVAAVEVSKVLGYDYYQVRNLFAKLNGSSALVCVDDGASYCRIGSDALPLYVQKDVLVGRGLAGRPPRLYVLKERLGIDMDGFMRDFNENGTQIWESAVSRVMEVARSLDPAYLAELIEDCLFVWKKVGPLLQMLSDHGVISIERTKDETDVNVPLKRGKLNYRVPMLKPLGRLI
jgi:hypothetical protein